MTTITRVVDYEFVARVAGHGRGSVAFLREVAIQVNFIRAWHGATPRSPVLEKVLVLLRVQVAIQISNCNDHHLHGPRIPVYDACGVTRCKVSF